MKFAIKATYNGIDLPDIVFDSTDSGSVCLAMGRLSAFAGNKSLEVKSVLPEEEEE